MNRLLIIVFALAASMTLLATSPASASSRRHPIRIASCRARGDFATCVAAGNARHHPLRIVLHVRSNPRQSVSGAWAMTCTKGTGAGGTHGQFHSGTPINKPLRKPYRHPDSCSVSADGQLARHGSLHIWLTYTN
jgi:hypothetical protein